MAKGSVTGAWALPALEAAFMDRLRVLRKETQGAVWVLVPTNLAGLHLRRAAAGALGGAADVHFLTLRDAAFRLAQQHLARRGMRPLPPGAGELALQRLLEELPPESPFGRFRRFRNAAPALRRAIHVLTDALWRPGALRQAAREGSFRDPTAPRRLAEMAGLWQEYNDWKADAGAYEDGDLALIAAGAEAGAAGVPDTLLLYGFYDFTPSQRLVLGRLVGMAPAAHAFLLWAEEGGAPAAGYEYAEPAVRWFCSHTGTDEVAMAPDATEPSDLSALMRRIFADAPSPTGTGDGSVAVLSCPHEASEAQEVVREVLREAGSGGGGLVGIMARSAEQAVPALAEALERSGVAYYAAEGLPLSATAAGRTALALVGLATGEAERDAVVEFLGLATGALPRSLSPSVLDRAARRAGVVRGRKQWLRRLRSRAEHLRNEAGAADNEADAEAMHREADICARGAGALEDLFERIGMLVREGAADSWLQVAQRLADLVGEFAPEEAAGREAVLEAVGDLRGLDISGTRPDPATLHWVLSRRLAGASQRCSAFQCAGVAVTGLEKARGAVFDTVIVPGLTEKSFPMHAGRTSLLTELDREELSRVAERHAAGPLPTQAQRPAEERYLFRLALGSARRRVVLAYPRMEEHSDRTRIPSRFLTAAASALSGEDVTGNMLNQGTPEGLVRRVPLTRTRGLEAGELQHALHEQEFDAAVYSGGEGGLRTGYMAAVSPRFARSLKVEKQRWRRPSFGSYDGIIGAADLLAHLGQSYGPQSRPVSPSRLETYAGCPFDYFVRYVLDVSEVEEPPDAFELSPLERGSLMHDLLKNLYEELFSGRILGKLTDTDAAKAVERAGELLDELGGAHAENHPAVWRAERERILSELEALIRHEREKHPQARPSRFEYSFGTGAEGFAPAADVAPVRFRGRIDRIDWLANGGIQVIDYKTGKVSKYYKSNSLRGGKQLQMPIYLLAAADELGAGEGRSLYLSVAEQKDVPEFALEEIRQRAADLHRVLEMILEGIRTGRFIQAAPDDQHRRRHCEKHCAHGIICGAARQALVEMKQGDPQMQRVRELREIE